MPMARKDLVAVLHLAPLPGSPRAAGGMEPVLDQALREAELYRQAGIGRVMVENHGDAPFHASANPPEVVAGIAVIADRLRREFELEVGINLLRNDALGALGAAAACGARMIRVNLLAGAAATDQGLLEGPAAELMRRRRHLAPDLEVWADLEVKFSAPLYRPDLVDLARSTRERALADALILTGPATGQAVDLRQLEALKKALPRTRVYVGSGANADNLGEYLALADGVIVGSALKRDGYVENPVDPTRLARFVEAFRFVA